MANTLSLKRKEKGLTILGLSNLIGVNPSTIWRLETNATKPLPETADALAKVLETTVQDLFGEDGKTHV